ncbi:MAG TPA: abortive infection family protein [Leadbetterella sp.]|nr:abortive infection family protein [Leadbetterella sp.]
MNDKISPKYLMNLISSIKTKIETLYTNDEDVKFYLVKWHEGDNNNFNSWQNFYFSSENNGNINLNKTLNSMEGELLLKIAIDLGVETPDYIPSIPIFRNEIKTEFKNASTAFETAFRSVKEDPSTSISLANSALESIVKEILKDDRLLQVSNNNDTLYKLSIDLLKNLKLISDENIPEEIKHIGRSLINICQNIEKLRSEKTLSHGRVNEDYLITDSLFTYFTVNSVATVGLFLNSFYKAKFPKKLEKGNNDLEGEDDLPF